MNIGSRKLDHITISLEKKVQSHLSNGFEDVVLVHRALPEVNRDEVDVSGALLGRKIKAPIMIAGMTGGHKKSEVINKNLALAAEKAGIPMGVGSQRAALEDESLASTFSTVREASPAGFLIGNLGATQFCQGYSLKEARKAVEMIRADALAVHLNPLHEAVQPGGDTTFKDCLRSLGRLKGLGVPIIAKETGGGIAREEAALLEKAGCAVIDVGGLGGTSFAAIEHYRAKVEETLGKLFWDWGIPTAVSVVECSQATKTEIIATGGIRNGIQVAKALALGANCCGIALPLLDKALKGPEEVARGLVRIVEELRTAMFLVGAENVRELKSSDVVIMGRTREWLEARGIDCKEYANRR